MEAISSLTELGYSRRDAARALQHADGDVDVAYGVSTCLSACNHPQTGLQGLSLW